MYTGCQYRLYGTAFPGAEHPCSRCISPPFIWVKARYGHFIGRQWIILHREVVEWLVESGAATDAADWLETTFIPDETVFQSIFAQPGIPFSDQLHIGNKWCKDGGPMPLTEEEYANAVADGSFFARKVSPQLQTETRGQGG